MHRRARHLNARHAGAGLVLDARRLTGLNDGGAVSTWSDASGNGWDATGTSTSRPLYKTAIQGGQPVLRFDGLDDNLQITASGAIDFSKNVGGITAIAVCVESSITGDGFHQILFFSKNASGLTRFGLYTRNNSTSGSFCGARRLDADSVTFSNTAGTVSSFFVLSGVANFASGNVSSGKNGIQAIAASLPSSGNTSNTSSTAVRVGATDASTNRFFGDCGIIVAINSIISSGLKKRLEHSAAFSFKIQCS
jgi:hypothetical protein